MNRRGFVSLAGLVPCLPFLRHKGWRAIDHVRDLDIENTFLPSIVAEIPKPQGVFVNFFMVFPDEGNGPPTGIYKVVFQTHVPEADEVVWLNPWPEVRIDFDATVAYASEAECRNGFARACVRALDELNHMVRLIQRNIRLHRKIDT